MGALSLTEFTIKSVGVPFLDRGRERSGWDCWGMLHALFLKVFSIRLPDDSTLSCQDIKEVSRRLAEGARAWVEVPRGSERPGDVLMIRPCHVGVVLGQRRMLHCREGAGTCIDRYDSAIWRQRISGIYRHAESGSHSSST